MTSPYTPDYLIIGHVTKDNTPKGPLLGGTCSYSALTAHRLGQKVAILTSAGPDIPSMALLEDIPKVCVASKQSTTFKNIYEDGERRQKWLSSSTLLQYKDIPSDWQHPAIVHFGPIGQEVSPAVCAQFPNSLVGATIQGWLRGQGEKMNVIYQPHPALEENLHHIDVLVISLSDVFGDKKRLQFLLNTVKIGVETLGPDGCRVYENGQSTHIPVKDQKEVEPTGAGDIFAAAFFIKYQQSKDSLKAAQFANACASLSVRKRGLNGVPTLANVEAQMVEMYGS